MIPQIKKILYATDLSENSSYAFFYAIDLAQRHDAKIVILHVIEPIPGYIERRFGSVGREVEEVLLPWMEFERFMFICQ
jgi:nucleotide-binding universal stress UspA family protein